MRSVRPSRLVAVATVLPLLLAVWTSPAGAFHRERRAVQEVVTAYEEMRHHLDEAQPDWPHAEEELARLAKPIRALGHHDDVDLVSPMEASVRRRDREALERGFRNVFQALVRENLHRAGDTAGELGGTLKGFIQNARAALGPLAARKVPGTASRGCCGRWRWWPATPRR